MKNEAIETAQAAAAAQMEEILQLLQKVEQLEATVASIPVTGQAATEQPARQLTRPTVEAGGKTYQFLAARFVYNDNILTAEAAADDELLLAELLKNAPGIFTEITPDSLTTSNT